MEGNAPGTIAHFGFQASKWASQFSIEGNRVKLKYFDSYGVTSKDPIPRDHPVTVNFRIVEGKNYPIWFGITSAAHVKEKSIQFGSDIVHYYTDNKRGFLSVDGSEKQKSSELILKDNDVVRMIVDAQKQEITWSKNDTLIGTNHYPALSQKDFFVYIQMWKDGQTVDIS